MPILALHFADTDVFLYLLSSDPEKARLAREVVAQRPVVSVQVLNEIANILRRKDALPWHDIDEFVCLLRGLCPIEPVTLQSMTSLARWADVMRYPCTTP